MHIAERQVLAVAERMKARGHNVFLIVLMPRQSHEFQTDIEGFRRYRAKRNGQSRPGAHCSTLRYER